MAKKVKVDVYELVDSEGKVVGTQRLKEGTERYETAKKNRENGVGNYFYHKSGSDEEWTPTSEATANVQINPVGGTIEVTGPEWLTSQIVNSDTFKKNYSENKALLSAVNLFRQSPIANVETNSGETMPVAQLIGKYADQASLYASKFAEIKDYKETQNKKFGVNLSDEDVAIARSVYDKADYNADSAVYVPKWAIKHFNWSDLDSWDPKEGTVSAKDFFETVYRQDFDTNIAERLQNEAFEKMSEALEKNSFDRDSEDAAERQKELEDPEYASQLARTIQMYRTMELNTPKTSAAYNFKEMATSAVNTFIQGAYNNGMNAAESLATSNDSIINMLSLGNSDLKQPIGFYFNHLGPGSQNQIAAFITGEILNAIGGANSKMEAQEVMDAFMDDLHKFVYVDGDLGKSMSEQHAKIDAIFDEYNTKKNSLNDWWSTGEFIGYMGFKAVQAIMVVNGTGASVGNAVSSALSSGGFSTMAAKVLGEKGSANLIKGLAKGANITSQAVLETVLDNKQLVDKAIASGEMTDELWDTLVGNWVGNAIAEAGLPLFGKGVKKVGSEMVARSATAKIISAGTSRVVAGARAIHYGATASFFALLHGVKPNPDSIAEAICAAEAGSSRRLALYNIGLQFARRDMAMTIWHNPIFKQVSEELADTTNSSFAFVYGGAKYLNATTEAEQKAAVKEGIEAAESKVEKEYAEEAAKRAGKSKSILGEKFNKRISENYEVMRKNILLRANFENQIDQISKGAIQEWGKIKQYAAQEYKDLADAGSKAAQLEQQAVKNGVKLDFWGKGTVLSKQSSRYLSLLSQTSRYRWMIEQAVGGDWKKALNSEGERLFRSKADFENIKAIVKANDAEIAALKKLLGDDLAASLDDLLPKAGRFHAKVTEYMGAHGYMDADEYALFRRLANNQGWGENGEMYIPTSRLTEEDLEYGFHKSNAWLKAENTPSRRMVDNGIRKLQPGAEGEFGDPLANLYIWSVTQAKIAQAQEFGRALFAVSAPIRAVKGYDANGISKYEASIMGTSIKELRDEFAKNLSSKDTYNFPKYYEAIREAVNQGNVYGQGLTRMKEAGDINDSLKAAKKQKKIARERINKQLFGEDSAATRSSIVSLSSDADVSDLIAGVRGKNNMPVFNPSELNEADFDEWYEALPQSSKDIIKNRLYRRKPTFKNVSSIAQADPELVTLLKHDYINNLADTNPKFANSKKYKEFIEAQYRKAENFKVSAILNDDIKDYDDAIKEIAELEAKKAGMEKLDLKNFESFGEPFVKQVEEIQSTLVEELRHSMRNNRVFKEIMEKAKEAISKTTDNKKVIEKTLQECEDYLILRQLTDMSADELVAPLLKGDGHSVAAGISKKAAKKFGKDNYEKLTKVIGSGLKNNIDSSFNDIQQVIMKKGYGDVLDAGKFFDDLSKHMDEIEKTYGFKQGKEVSTMLDQAQRRKIVELVGPDGQLRFYETDRLYASLANEPVGSFSAGRGPLGTVSSTINSIFRWGTTGIDKTSYVNQWFRDTMNAVIIGGYRPFMDLTSGGLASKLASAYYDLGLPFGTKIFGKLATQNITDEVVESVFESAREGMIKEFGQEWFDAFTKEATAGLTGEEAEVALKRAVAQYTVGDMGYSRVPGMGGTTRAEFFRAGSKGMEEQTVFGLSKERAEVIFGKADITPGIQKMGNKFTNFLDEIGENWVPSKGSFREEFLRKGVFTSQYRLAIESGMTHAEANAWATRYALDATTNFNRTFMWGNSFIKSVPYLGAAINGSKSFWRLVEMDPVGVTKRFVFGLGLPYARMLSLSLSSEENRKAYANVREYEKEDNMVFVYKGRVVSIPAPQELSSFLAPFRHVIEKAADVQDNSWLDLTASDALGILPLDLSGFVNLDANSILADGDNGLWSRIGRGVEKAASGLMDPVTKSVWMLASGHDPYTGAKIDRSYYTTDEEGNLVLMDSHQEGLAKLIHEKFPDLSCSAAQKILQTLFGRSTITVADGAYSILDGSFDPAKIANEQFEAVLKPLEAGTYNMGRSEWNDAQGLALQKREELINDEQFQKAYKVMIDKNYSEEKRKDAQRIYNEKLDAYTKYVLDFTKSFKEKYPDQYTSVRMAQVLSMLSLPTGYTFTDTDYSAEIRQDSYYDARNAAIETFISMGFPTDTANNTMLGSGYYDKYGQYQFKIFTPYEIEYYNTTMYGTDERIRASVKAALKAADINTSDMWKGYYAASNKAERKEWWDAWNSKVVKTLYPLVSKYGIETVVNNNDTVDLLDNYIHVDNPYKTKQYIKSVFGGEE